MNKTKERKDKKTETKARNSIRETLEYRTSIPRKYKVVKRMLLALPREPDDIPPFKKKRPPQRLTKKEDKEAS